LHAPRSDASPAPFLFSRCRWPRGSFARCDSRCCAADAWQQLFVSANTLTQPLVAQAGGIVLPNPGYYDIIYNGTRDDDQKEDRDQIWQYYKDLNFLSGLSKEEAEDMANKTIEAETVLAQWQVDEPWDDSDDADPKGSPLTNLTALVKLCPNVPWRRIFQAMSDQCKEYGWTCNEALLADEALIVMGAPYFYTKLNAALGGNMTIAYWKPWLRTHYIYNLAPLLNIEFLEANLKLDTYMSGITKLPRREKKMCWRRDQRAFGTLGLGVHAQVFQRRGPE
jgi:predicted metalloendopeptidase